MRRISIQPPRIPPVVKIAVGLLSLACFAIPAGSQVAGEAASGRDFPAVLLPGSTALLKAEFDERVAEVLVATGSRVKAGQVMIRFVDAEERVLVQRAEILVRQAEAEHARMQRLHSEAQSSNELLENAVTSLRLAEALQRAGCAVTVETQAGTNHRNLARRVEAMGRLGVWLAASTAGATSAAATEAQAA